jgi:hypothetical protein
MRPTRIGSAVSIPSDLIREMNQGAPIMKYAHERSLVAGRLARDGRYTDRIAIVRKIRAVVNLVLHLAGSQGVPGVT